MNPPAPFRFRLAAWLAVALWAGTITYFSSLSGPEIQQLGLTFWDKAQHFSAFAVGGAILALALRWSVTWPWKRLVRFAVVALMIFGALDEFHQVFTPRRSGADPLDWLADCFGALVGVALFVVIYARFFRTDRPAPAGA